MPSFCHMSIVSLLANPGIGREGKVVFVSSWTFYIEHCLSTMTSVQMIRKLHRLAHRWILP